MAELTLIQGDPAQLAAAAALIADGRAYLKAQGLSQWQGAYPDLETLREDLRRGRGYFAADDDGPAAYLVIDFDGEPAYETIRGGWIGRGPYATIHRLAVSARRRGRGLSRTVLALAETVCRQRGVGSVRADTDPGNLAMQRALQAAGFVRCGVITFAGSDKLAYEKLL